MTPPRSQRTLSVSQCLEKALLLDERDIRHFHPVEGPIYVHRETSREFIASSAGTMGQVTHLPPAAAQRPPGHQVREPGF